MSNCTCKHPESDHLHAMTAIDYLKGEACSKCLCRQFIYMTAPKDKLRERCEEAAIVFDCAQCRTNLGSDIADAIERVAKAIAKAILAAEQNKNTKKESE